MRGKPRISRNKRLAKANNASPKGAFRLSAAERKKYNRMTDKEDKMNGKFDIKSNKKPVNKDITIVFSPSSNVQKYTYKIYTSGK